MEIELNDQSLMFLAFDWNTGDSPSEIRNLVQSFQTLWYLHWIIEENKAQRQNRTQTEELQDSLLSQLNRLLDSLSRTLLGTKPEKALKGTTRLEEIQRDFENVLLTLGEEGRYREHAHHQKRNYFLGVLLVDRLNLDLLDKSVRKCWHPVAGLHDFCYIIQEVEKVIEKLGKRIDGSIPGLKFSMKVASTFGSEFLAEKQKRILASIARLDEKTATAEENYFSLLEKMEDRDHGVFSALFVHDLLFREEGEFSPEELKLITRAIAFHTNGRTRCKVRVDSDPLAGLLILCDEIQEWKRPRAGRGEDYVPSIRLRNIAIDFRRWRAENEFLEALQKGRSFRVFDFTTQVGEKTFEVKVNLKFNKIKDRWSLDVRIETEYQSKLDRMDLDAFKERITSELNNLAESLFKKNLNKRMSEDDLGLKLAKNQTTIRGNIRILGKMRELPATANPRIFDIMFSWVLLRYVRRKQPRRQSVKLSLEKDQPLDFHMPHLASKKREQSFSFGQQRKIDNLKRIDYAKNQIYKKIVISSKSGEEREIRLFPCDEHE